MRVSLRWLAEYVELPPISPAELAERLTLAGIEVESTTELGVKGVVAAQVVGIERHPRANQLKLCHLQTGAGEVTVVCGADNVVQGGFVAYAPPGARLPGMVVEEQNVRGVRSPGMILSRQELGLEPKSAGIWNLPPGTSPGSDLSSFLEFPDVVLSLKITSNRPDLLGVYGLAREVSALFNTQLRPVEVDFAEDGPPAAQLAAVQIESGEDCPRYIARVFEVLEGGVSPLQVEVRLLKAGMRPLALLVDLTNYVMLELGRPLHAFDHRRVQGGRIVVRRACPGERIRTLDGVDRELSPEVLVIADAEKPVALAGVMGGEEAEVSPDTKVVLLESACFHAARVRRSARQVGLRTEASLRFERGLSPDGAELASRRFAALLARHARVRIARGAVEAYPAPRTPVTLTLRKARVAEVLGVDVPGERVEQGLSRMGLHLLDQGPSWKVEVPGYRADLEREIDLIEEVARVYGYDRIPLVPPRVAPRAGAKDPGEAFADRVRQILVGLGLDEVYTIPLVPEAHAEVRLRNPMAEGQQGLRGSLMHGLLEAAEENVRAQAAGAALFEVGRVFSGQGAEVTEADHVGVVVVGRPPIPLSGKAEYGPQDLKGILEALLGALRVDASLGPCEHPDLHPGRRATVRVDGNVAGWLGEVAGHRRLGKLEGRRVFVLELNLSLLRQYAASVSYRPLPRYPASKRDLSLLVPAQVEQARVVTELLAQPLVESAFLYDAYQGPGIPEGAVGLTYEVVFRHPERTLASEEVESVVQKILDRLEPLGVRLRM